MLATHKRSAVVSVFIKTHANDTNLWQSEGAPRTPDWPVIYLILCCLRGRHNWIGLDAAVIPFFSPNFTTLKVPIHVLFMKCIMKRTPWCHFLGYDVNACDRRNSGISNGLASLREQLHQHFHYFCRSSSKASALRQSHAALQHPCVSQKSNLLNCHCGAWLRSSTDGHL